MKTLSRSFLAGVVSLFVTDILVAGIVFADPGMSVAESSKDHSKQRIRFTAVSSYGGRRGSGIEFSASDYDSTNGVGVVATIERYASANRARAEMMRRIKRATKIVEGVSAKRVSRLYTARVVLLESGRSRAHSYAVVLRQEQEVLRIIESGSLDVALEFERQFFAK